MTTAPTTDTAPQVDEFIRVRGQQWVVSRLSGSRQARDESPADLPGRTLVTVTGVGDEDPDAEPTVAWDIEPRREVLPEACLPNVTETGWDSPIVLGSFLNAIRWRTVASAGDTPLQAPFRVGVTIADYKLKPVAKALAMPRVNLLIADDVRLGKTIQAGLFVQEMLLRHRARRVLVVCPAPLTGKRRDELDSKFVLGFTVLDTETRKALRRSRGLEANPFTVFPRTIISLPWLRTPRVQRLLDEVLADNPAFCGLTRRQHCRSPERASTPSATSSCCPAPRGLRPCTTTSVPAPTRTPRSSSFAIRAEIDEAVMAAYGWDLDLEVEPTKVGTRWTVSPRFELRDLLLKENRRRAGVEG